MISPSIQKGVAVLKRTITVRQPRRFRLPEKGEIIVHGDRRYFMGEKVGQGGFGVVYECTDEWGNALVAKVLLPHERRYAEVRESWLEETGKLLELRHPNITYVHDAFEHQDTFYLVIERCNFPLMQVITSIGVDVDRWIPYVARDVLQALDYIHARGYVHKDLHPGNIFVTESRQQAAFIHRIVWSFKVGDLGLTRLESDIRVFQTLLAEWMRPPESYDPDKFGPVGRQVDIYQTGLVLLALMLKEIPYFTQEEVLGGIPQALAQKHDSRFAPVVAKALRRHVEWRTQTALEFWRELSMAATGKM
ncbi:MAG TPA: protein kinase [Burkholderiales bacterium]|nr:protein kinase [Burkholderiales bacterium]